MRRDIPLSELTDFLALPFVATKAGRTYAAGSAESVLVRLEPGHVRTWDFADEI